MAVKTPTLYRWSIRMVYIRYGWCPSTTRTLYGRNRIRLRWTHRYSVMQEVENCWLIVNAGSPIQRAKLISRVLQDATLSRTWRLLQPEMRAYGSTFEMTYSTSTSSTLARTVFPDFWTDRNWTASKRDDSNNDGWHDNFGERYTGFKTWLSYTTSYTFRDILIVFTTIWGTRWRFRHRR